MPCWLTLAPAVPLPGGLPLVDVPLARLMLLPCCRLGPPLLPDVLWPPHAAWQVCLQRANIGRLAAQQPATCSFGKAAKHQDSCCLYERVKRSFAGADLSAAGGALRAWTFSAPTTLSAWQAWYCTAYRVPA